MKRNRAPQRRGSTGVFWRRICHASAPLWLILLAAAGTDKVPDKVSLAAVPFPLQEVRLLDGPFKQAMQLDQQYLLSLEPDRLLYNFRVTAGLPSTAKPLGGWEA